MSNPLLIARATAPVIGLVRDITPDQLNSPTPCTEYDVRGLVNHLLIWGPSLEGAAHKESVVPPPPETDLTTGDWAADLIRQLERNVAAWSDPAAWEGLTFMAGPSELPAAMVGGMALCELLVHGWDLARGINQQPTWPDDVVTATYEVVAGMAEQGRQAGIFGPEVTVPATASEFDRMIALTGRDPSWSAS
jgi:uncharacterized protein (TIGR03086 family)